MDSCWIWPGHKAQHGYGTLMVKGRQMYAHRAMFEMVNGPIPNGMCACHRCDNPMCVRPDHLFLGTADDNAKDMVAKGRSLRAERHPRTRTTATMAEAIRDEYAAGGITQRQLATKYGERHQTISRILNGKRWVYAGGPLVPKDCRHFTPQARTARHATK